MDDEPEWETENERVVVWNAEQTRYLLKRLGKTWDQILREGAARASGIDPDRPL